MKFHGQELRVLLGEKDVSDLLGWNPTTDTYELRSSALYQRLATPRSLREVDEHLRILDRRMQSIDAALSYLKERA